MLVYFLIPPTQGIVSIAILVWLAVKMVRSKGEMPFRTVGWTSFLYTSFMTLSTILVMTSDISLKSIGEIINYAIGFTILFSLAHFGLWIVLRSRVPNGVSTSNQQKT